MFSQVSVCPRRVGVSGPMSFLGRWVSLVLGPFCGVGMSGGGVDTPQIWDLTGWYTPTALPRYGIQRDTVSKQAVRIFLECFLVFHVTSCLLVLTIFLDLLL